MSKTVADIIADYLRINGYDGLYGEECACLLSDLFPCGGEYALECYPGIRREATEEEKNAIGFDWFICKKELKP